MVTALALTLAIGTSGGLAEPVRGAPTVRLVRSRGAWELQRNGQPFYVRGAGARTRLDVLRRAGANSVRTWGAGPDLAPDLDRFHREGLAVTIGMWLNKQGQGMDYGDPGQVAAMVENVRKEVRMYRNHPSLLLWAVGNEMELGGDQDLVWPAVELAVRAVKEEDPGRPVMVVVADMWPEKMSAILRHAPSIDLLGVNSYGGLPTLAERMKLWQKPYLVTEWGYPTQQEAPKAPWGEVLEPTSTEKAAVIRDMYRQGIAAHPGRVLGSYAFYWGSPENFETSWFDHFLRSGERLEAVETLARIWGGTVGSNRAPRIRSVSLGPWLEAGAGETVNVRIDAADPDGDSLRTVFQVLEDDRAKRFVGDHEKPMEVVARGESGLSFALAAPGGAGTYRIVLKVKDGKGAAATAHIALRVR